MYEYYFWFIVCHSSIQYTHTCVYPSLIAAVVPLHLLGFVQPKLPTATLS